MGIFFLFSLDSTFFSRFSFREFGIVCKNCIYVKLYDTSYNVIVYVTSFIFITLINYILINIINNYNIWCKYNFFSCNDDDVLKTSDIMIYKIFLTYAWHWFCKKLNSSLILSQDSPTVNLICWPGCGGPWNKYIKKTLIIQQLN